MTQLSKNQINNQLYGSFACWVSKINISNFARIVRLFTCIQMETCYHWLNVGNKQLADALANIVILSKTYNESYEILERIASNNCQEDDVRSNPGKNT